jgi:polar amino acid transport system substrate-binding protein
MSIFTGIRRMSRGVAARILVAIGFLALVSLATTPAVADETLRVGISDSPPIMYLDKTSNKMTGFAVEVLRGMLKGSGLKPDIRVLPFAELLPALNADKLDMILMSPSAERRKSADFSKPFTRYGETVVVPDTDKTAYTSIAELGGKRVGSTANGGWADTAKKAGATLVPFSTVADALAALRDGKLDAVVGNRPSYDYLLKSGSYPGLHMVASYKPTQFNELSFGFRKGDTLRRERIDAALTKFMQGPNLGILETQWGFAR